MHFGANAPDVDGEPAIPDLTDLPFHDLLAPGNSALDEATARLIRTECDGAEGNGPL